MRSCYINLVGTLQKKLPVESRLLKHAIAIDPEHKLDKSTPKSLKYLAEKIGLSIKSTLKSTVEEYVDRVLTEFQLFLTDNSFNDKYERLDEYWWIIHDASNSYKILSDLAFNVMTLSVANVPAEEGFSINKDFLDGRSSLSEKSLISLRLTKDTLLHYEAKKVTNFPITRELLTFCSKAYRRYELDLKSKKDAEALEKAEMEKRAKDIDKQNQKDKVADFEKKKKEIELKIGAAKKLLAMGHEKITRGVKTNNMGVVMDGNSNQTEALKRISELETELKNVGIYFCGKYGNNILFQFQLNSKGA